jgi:hypothetical protein
MNDHVSRLSWFGLCLTSVVLLKITFKSWKKITLLACFLIQPFAFAQNEVPRYELGTAFNLIRTGSNNNYGLGGRGVYNPTSYLSFEAEINGFLANSTPSTVDGGRIVEGLLGAKAGLRMEHVGIFGKVRPGVISFGNTVRGITFTPLPIPLPLPLPIGVPSIHFGRLTRPALDLGGVMEFYPAKHWSLRYDVGSTLVFYNQRRIATPLGDITVPGRTKHDFQFSTGIHYRF